VTQKGFKLALAPERKPAPLHQDRQLQDPYIHEAVANAYQATEGFKLEVDAPGVLGNDINIFIGTAYVVEYREVGDFQGHLKVYTDGSFTYFPPDNFFSTETFTYIGCQVGLCEPPTNVVITVVRDPNKPRSPPIAVSDTYNAVEDETLRISAAGVLSNDRSGTPTNPLFVCDKGGDPRGSVHLDKDGSFTYRIGRCKTGSDSFTYRACNVDYPELESGDATVNINIRNAQDRPGVPRAQADSYTVIEGKRLEVPTSEGVLANDVNAGDTLRVTDTDKQGGFRGSLDVRSRGGFTYRAPNEIGTYRFNYEACHSGWECVACATGTASIQVVVDPDKPTSPPTATADTYEVVVGETLKVNASGVLENDSGDNRYNLIVTDYDTSAVNGTFNGERNGSFEYGNAPVGVQTIPYTVCFEEFRDLCADGQISITTIAQIETGSTTRKAPPGILTISGDNGRPSEAFPLKICEADCDSDADCEENSICFQRRGNEVVPGCVGNPVRERDYCILRQPPKVQLFPSLVTVGSNGSPQSAYPLSECEGSCLTDADCVGNLICLERSAGSIIVPGCAGAAEGDIDYCIKPRTETVVSRKQGGAPDLFN